MRRIEKFVTSDGRSPFSEWVSGLDKVVQGRIYAFVDRVSMGAGKKNLKALGEGVFEIRIDVGPGYRVYFGQTLKALILLIGGDKSTQTSDIKVAKRYWSIYEQSKHL
jgi:putative addiction module killer protein